jgi:aminoglycoside 3-N-acetyltransferase
MSIARWLPESARKSLKARLKRFKAWYATTFRSYDRSDLLSALRALGVQPGDTVMLHSAWSREHGFQGTVGDLVDTFVEAVGPGGHLLMVTLPYRNAALDWLESGRRFDVRKTPSMMGMVSEVFRRREGVLRSVHPTHPIAVFGPHAARFVAGHPNRVHPCGPGTPFDELARADGRVVFLDVPIDTFTFFHYLEHLVHETLPFPLYTETTYEATVIDADGRERTVRTHAFARDAIRRRRPERLYGALFAKGLVAEQCVGASRLLAVRVRDAIEVTRELERDGALFYDLAP